MLSIQAFLPLKSAKEKRFPKDSRDLFSIFWHHGAPRVPKIEALSKSTVHSFFRSTWNQRHTYPLIVYLCWSYEIVVKDKICIISRIRMWRLQLATIGPSSISRLSFSSITTILTRKRSNPLSVLCRMKWCTRIYCKGPGDQFIVDFLILTCVAKCEYMVYSSVGMSYQYTQQRWSNQHYIGR